MNRVKACVTTYLKRCMEVTILLMIYRIWFKICVSNETEDVNVHAFEMITEKNESKTITKHILCKCKCKFDGKNVI